MKIDTLAHNIQGFDSNAEQLEQEQKDLQAYREKLMKKTKEINLMMAAKMKHVAACAGNKMFTICSTWSILNGSLVREIGPRLLEILEQRGPLGLKE